MEALRRDASLSAALHDSYMEAEPIADAMAARAASALSQTTQAKPSSRSRSIIRVCRGVGFLPGALHSMNRTREPGRSTRRSGHPTATPGRKLNRSGRPRWDRDAATAAFSTLASGVICHLHLPYPNLHGPSFDFANEHWLRRAFGRAMNASSANIGATLALHFSISLSLSAASNSSSCSVPPSK